MEHKGKSQAPNSKRITLSAVEGPKTKICHIAVEMPKSKHPQNFGAKREAHRASRLAFSV